MGVFENMGRDFQQGYRNGQQQAENNNKMMIFFVRWCCYLLHFTLSKSGLAYQCLIG